MRIPLMPQYEYSLKAGGTNVLARHIVFAHAMKANFRGFFLLLFVSLTLDAGAQWRIATPRDTVFVSAKKKQTTGSKMSLNAGVEAMLWVSGEYKMMNSTAIFDGGYCRLFPGWILPTPLRTTPPYYYNSVKYDFGLKYQTIPGIAEYWFVPTELSYQTSHFYSTKVVSAGNALQFYIKAPNDTYYTNAQDGLTVRLARWTAGIAVKNYDVKFGSVLIGSSASYLDSIASYGIDPLQVEKMEIIGADSSAFTFISQRNAPFTLPNELANEIKLIFTPQKRDSSRAQLRITLKNSDAPSRTTIIQLRGFGEEPKLNVPNKEIDFGIVRIGYPKTLPTIFFNSGNSTLTINQLRYATLPLPDSVFGKSPLTSLPLNATPNSSLYVHTVCSPVDTIAYSGFVYLSGNNNQRDTIKCKCRGGRPIPILSDSLISFGQVYTGDIATQKVTMRNRGNWPVSVINVELLGSVFSVAPSDNQFIVEPDSIKEFIITFNPTSTNPINFRNYLVFFYDDYSRDTVILTGQEKISVLQYTPLSHDFGKVKIGASKTDTVTNIRNNGLIPATFEYRDVRPDRPFDIAWMNTVPASSIVPLMGTFTPLVPGPITAMAYMTSNGKRDSVLLTGIGAIAKAIVNPKPLDFGIVKSGIADTATVTVTDSGTLALNVVRYEITGPDKNDFRVIAIRTASGAIIDTPFTIVEGATVEFDVEFKTNAKTGAAHVAELCLYYDDNTSDCIPLQGIEEAQMVQFATSSVDFGKVRVKTHKIDTAKFRNGSNIVLSVGSVLVNSQTDVFTVIGSLLPIAPNTTLSLPVDFYPTLRGVYNGYLKAEGGDIRTDSIQLRGIGAAPIPIVSDTVINFGKVPFLTQSNPQPLLIINMRDDSLGTDWLFQADSIFLRGDENNEFSWRSAKYGDLNNVDTIAIGDFSEYSVTFTPKAVTIYHEAELVFLLDDKSEVIVRLVGLDESPNIVLGEDTVSFGKVRVGTGFSQKDVHLINTWSDTLIVGSLRLEPTAGEFASITPLGNNISVLPNLPGNAMPIELTFTPSSAGLFSARLISSGADALADTTFLIGEGASPKAKFTPDLVLDFGEVLYSSSITRTFQLKNIGNWIFSTVKVNVVGTNAADFDVKIANVINIEEDSARIFSVTFLATTPIQIAPRTATLEFMLDDSSVVTYELQAIDRAPLPTDLRWDKVAARIGDVVYPNLRLVNPIPDSLNINSVIGDVAYDMSVVELIGQEIGEGMDGWTMLIDNTTTPGVVHYELNSETQKLTKPISLLRLKFKAKEGVQPGAQSPLTHVAFDYPGRKEVQALLTNGVIVIDSACGNTHLSASSPKASFIEQNRPNPFGASQSNVTEIPFTVGDDDTPVSLRVLDMTGNEVLTLIRGTYARGRYTAKLDASQLPSGTYMYEYRAGSSKPQVKKLVVGK
jgi:hypothetical protein